MGKERSKIVVGEEKSIAAFKKKPSQETTTSVAEKHGFTRRKSEPVMLNRSSPYIVPYGCNTRVGMKELAALVALRLNLYKQEAHEEGLLALIEKHGFDDLKEKFEELTK